jgi:hypothetical protein
MGKGQATKQWTHLEVGLHRFTKMRVLNDRVHRRLGRKLGIELQQAKQGVSSSPPLLSLTPPQTRTHITSIRGTLHTRLERRFNRLRHELLKVDVLGKEGVTLDLLGTVDA